MTGRWVGTPPDVDDDHPDEHLSGALCFLAGSLSPDSALGNWRLDWAASKRDDGWDGSDREACLRTIWHRAQEAAR